MQDVSLTRDRELSWERYKSLRDKRNFDGTFPNRGRLSSFVLNAVVCLFFNIEGRGCRIFDEGGGSSDVQVIDVGEVVVSPVVEFFLPLL